MAETPRRDVKKAVFLGSFYGYCVLAFVLGFGFDVSSVFSVWQHEGDGMGLFSLLQSQWLLGYWAVLHSHRRASYDRFLKLKDTSSACTGIVSCLPSSVRRLGVVAGGYAALSFSCCLIIACHWQKCGLTACSGSLELGIGTC